MKRFSELEAKYGDEFNWREITQDDTYFTNEAYKEISRKHPLYKIELKTIAKCDSNDDVLYQMENGKYVIIHLTYNSNKSNLYPRFKEFFSADEALDYIERKFIEEYI